MANDKKKVNKGVIVMICNIVIMIANYISNLLQSQSDTVARVAEKVTSFMC